MSINSLATIDDCEEEEEEEQQNDEEQVTPAIDENPNLTITGDQPVIKKRKIDWEIYGLPSHRRKMRELGPVVNNISTCFGCSYVGERNNTIIRYKQLVELIDMIRQSIVHCDPIVLCNAVALKYKKIQDDINEHLQPSEEPLPDWFAPMIMDHIENHNTDPQIQLMWDLRKLQELKQISSNSSVEIDPDTGDKRVNPQQCKVYQDLLKTYWQLAKIDTTKCAFASNESYVDMKAACEPIIAFSGKTIIDYMTENKSNNLM